MGGAMGLACRDGGAWRRLKPQGYRSSQLCPLQLAALQLARQAAKPHNMLLCGTAAQAFICTSFEASAGRVCRRATVRPETLGHGHLTRKTLRNAL